MVSIAERLHGGAGIADWWRRPRWLVLPLALPVFLTFGLAIGTLVNLGFTEGWTGQGGAVLAASGEMGGNDGVSGNGLASAQVCERMHYIVDTACSLKQRDRDASDIQRCVDHELKYTMWSAYGCK